MTLKDKLHNRMVAFRRGRREFIAKYIKAPAFFIYRIIDFVDIVFFSGLVFMGVGAETLRHGVGLLSVGVALVFYVKPIRSWWKK